MTAAIVAAIAIAFTAWRIVRVGAEYDMKQEGGAE